MSTGNEVDTLCQEARGFIKRGDLKQAVERFEQALQIDSRSVPAHEGLGLAYFRMKEYDKALEHFRRVTLIDPKKSQAVVNMGAIHNRRQDYHGAVKLLRQAIARDRRCAEAYYNLGIAHKGLKQYGMAVSAYKEAIRLAPEMAEAYQNLANCLMEMGNSSQAILNYQRALDLRPDFESARVGLEKATSQVEAAKRSISPFGRLVDMQAMASGVHHAKFRELSPQERFEDRSNLHRLAKEIEQSAAMFVAQLRQEVEISLLRLNHAFAQGASTSREFDRFVPSLMRFRESCQKLNAVSRELRDHEQRMAESSSV